MFTEKEGKRGWSRTVILLLVLLVGAVVWLVPAAMSGDLRWFWPGIAPTPGVVAEPPSPTPAPTASDVVALPTGTPPAGTALPPTGTPPAGTALLGPGET